MAISRASPRPAPHGSRPPRTVWTIRPNDVLTAIGFGAALVALWPIVLALRVPGPPNAVVLLAHEAGMLAGYGVTILIGLMSRTPALERGVGADRLAAWHGRGGRVVASLMLLHVWAAIEAWAESRGETIPVALWHVLRLPWLISATIGTVLLTVVSVMSIRMARRRWSFERWHAVHLLTYIGVALAFTHQLAGPDLAGHRLLQVLWALLYTGVFALVLQYRVITPVRNAVRHRMRVTAIVPEAPGVVSVVVEGRHLDELAAESGQFFRWRFLTPDLWATAHPFSLSAAPSSDRLRLTVKALGDGSSRLQGLEPGTWVIAEGPYGAMTAARRTRRNVLLIAGGVGITPMRALFETMPLGPGQDLLLLYRVRTLHDVIFRAELESIATRRGARLSYLLSDPVGPTTAQLLHALVPDLPARDVYFCGPPGLADAVRRSVHAAGVPPTQFHEERFVF